MAYLAKLQLADSVYDALDCGYSLHRDVDLKGRPTSSVYGGNIRIVVESNDDTNIVAKLMNQSEPVSGNVTFQKGSDPTSLKQLSWENGYIMKYCETFDMTSTEPMQIYFEIFAEKILMGSGKVDHKKPE